MEQVKDVWQFTVDEVEVLRRELRDFDSAQVSEAIDELQSICWLYKDLKENEITGQEADLNLRSTINTMEKAKKKALEVGYFDFLPTKDINDSMDHDLFTEIEVKRGQAANALSEFIECLRKIPSPRRGAPGRPSSDASGLAFAVAETLMHHFGFEVDTLPRKILSGVVAQIRESVGLEHEDPTRAVRDALNRLREERRN